MAAPNPLPNGLSLAFSGSAFPPNPKPPPPPKRPVLDELLAGTAAVPPNTEGLGTAAASPKGDFVVVAAAPPNGDFVFVVEAAAPNREGLAVAAPPKTDGWVAAAPKAVVVTPPKTDAGELVAAAPNPLNPEADEAVAAVGSPPPALLLPKREGAEVVGVPNTLAGVLAGWLPNNPAGVTNVEGAVAVTEDTVLAVLTGDVTDEGSGLLANGVEVRGVDVG